MEHANNTTLLKVFLVFLGWLGHQAYWGRSSNPPSVYGNNKTTPPAQQLQLVTPIETNCVVRTNEQGVNKGALMFACAVRLMSQSACATTQASPHFPRGLARAHAVFFRGLLFTLLRCHTVSLQFSDPCSLPPLRPPSPAACAPVCLWP